MKLIEQQEQKKADVREKTASGLDVISFQDVPCRPFDPHVSLYPEGKLYFRYDSPNRAGGKWEEVNNNVLEMYGLKLILRHRRSKFFVYEDDTFGFSWCWRW